ncbi:unnamed protein product [Cuscuta campestris]|uniref:Myosin N-terminal SH3-like domain-containing protein n=1 Tax=Cuscuta campestris TaxID=132261 RepID=A0A484MIN8_9ASTE|nr:unnamed protein product [Cuscuta campestris]
MREHKKAKEAARIEEAQTEELVKLQSTLEEIRFQIKEANEMLMREREKAKENVELVEAKTEEHVKLQSDLEELRLQFQETKELLMREQRKAKETAEIGEAKTEEHVKLQTDLEEMRLQLQETKELLMREHRKAKETAEIGEAKTEENVKLLSALEEMRLQLQETKDLLVREQDRTKETTEIEESKTEEQLKLQLTLEETRLQFQETKELLMREQEKAKEIEDMEQAKTEENVRLRAALEEMRLQFQETKELLMKKCEKGKDSTAGAFVVQEAQVIDLEMVNKLVTENEILKVPAAQDIKFIDHEIVNKLTAENMQLKASVSSLEKKIEETEKKYEETTKLSEERLKQAMDAESKMIELKTDMQRIKEKLSDIETKDHIHRKQTLLNSQSKRMLGHFTLGNQPSENGHQFMKDPQAAKALKPFGTLSLRRSQIDRQRESVDILFKCIKEDLGFSEGKPVAAFTSVSSVVVGTHVWVEDPEVAWIDGEVVEINGGDITVNCTSAAIGMGSGGKLQIEIKYKSFDKVEERKWWHIPIITELLEKNARIEGKRMKYLWVILVSLMGCVFDEKGWGLNPERIGGDFKHEVQVHSGFLSAYDSKKGISLKATKETVEEVSSDDDNEFGLIIKKFHKFMKKEFEQKGRKHDGPPKCYGCGEIGHIKPRFPKAKHGNDKPGFKKQRAYISWGGDSGDESTDQEGEEAANLCLMVHEDQTDDIQETSTQSSVNFSLFTVNRCTASQIAGELQPLTTSNLASFVAHANRPHCRPQFSFAGHPPHALRQEDTLTREDRTTVPAEEKRHAKGLKTMTRKN